MYIPDKYTIRSLIISVAIVLGGLLLLSACSKNSDPNQSGGPAVNDHSLMNAARLGDIIRQIDSNATLTDSTWRFQAAEHVVAVIYDESADRMRIIIPITNVDKVSSDQHTRMLQANFDSALDARYAIAQDLIWGTFIHPLSPLTENEFLLGLGQTISVVETFGDTYSSGMYTFGAGDSVDMERQRMIDFLRNQTT